MKDRFVLLTKDAMCKSYLPIYGNKEWDMPNLSDLANKGTVFTRYYTAAPSTAMSFVSMFTQKNPYETRHQKYIQVTEQEKNTVFDKLYKNGYECRIIWDEKWISMAKRYSQCYGEHTFFDLININQTVGAHNTFLGDIEPNEELAVETINIIEEAVEKAANSTSGKLFLWIHLPHVLRGRNCYGSDLDMFDKVIGIVRKFFSDDSIYISADHGNMNGQKNKICYGFDVYEAAINIPMITPRINDLGICDIPISNVHLYDLFNGVVCEDEFVYSDCAYYEQLHRKLAIMRGEFKYIYNKEHNTEELYDLKYDPFENCNIVQKKVIDVDRKVLTPLDQVYYYPNWDEAYKVLELLRNEKKRIWRQESKIHTILLRIRRRLGWVRAKIRQRMAK